MPRNSTVPRTAWRVSFSGHAFHTRSAVSIIQLTVSSTLCDYSALGHEPTTTLTISMDSEQRRDTRRPLYYARRRWQPDAACRLLRPAQASRAEVGLPIAPLLASSACHLDEILWANQHFRRRRHRCSLRWTAGASHASRPDSRRAGPGSGGDFPPPARSVSASQESQRRPTPSRFGNGSGSEVWPSFDALCSLME